jgi:hypothetical protein
VALAAIITAFYMRTLIVLASLLTSEYETALFVNSARASRWSAASRVRHDVRECPDPGLGTDVSRLRDGLRVDVRCCHNRIGAAV